MPRVWEILKNFKDLCNHHGWKTTENDDWIKINDVYHNFLCTRYVYPSSFKKITLNKKCVIRDDFSYQVVEPSYTAWLFSEAPSKNLVETIFENPDFSSKIALYDLSPLLEGKKHCVTLNHTDSSVFQEFEQFLKNEFKIKLKPFSPISDSTINPDEQYTIPELA